MQQQSIRALMTDAMHKMLRDRRRSLSSCNELKYLVIMDILPETSKLIVDCFDEIYDELAQEPDICVLISKRCCAHCKHRVNGEKSDVCVLLKPRGSFKRQGHRVMRAAATEIEAV